MTDCRPITRVFLIAFLLWGGALVSTQAHTGEVVLQQVVEPYRVTVFATPTPLAAGPAEFHVLLQEASSSETVLDAEMELRLTRLDETLPTANEIRPVACNCHTPAVDPTSTLVFPATRDDGRNLLFYTAIADVPSAGTWKVEVDIQREDQLVLAGTELLIRKPISAMENYWMWWAFPPVVIGLFAIRQTVRVRANSVE